MKRLWVILFVIPLFAQDELEDYVEKDFNILIIELSEFEEEIIDKYIEFMKVEKRPFHISNLFYRLSKNPTELIYITKLIKNTRLIEIRLKPLQNKRDDINNNFISQYNSFNEKLLIEQRVLLLCQGIQLIEDFQLMFDSPLKWESLLEEYSEFIIRIGVEERGLEELKFRNELFKFSCQDILLPGLNR